MNNLWKYVSAPRSRRAMLVVGLLSLVACGDDERRDKSEQSGPCAHDVLEADLERAPFMGPAVDESTGELRLSAGKRYIVSSTYGVPKPGTDGTPVPDSYLQVFGAIQQQLAAHPGLLALALVQSPGCGSGRTLAVWESEDQMYDFVTSPAHLTAMRKADELLKPGYAVTHWEASSREAMTFEEAVKELAKVEAH